MDQGSLRKKRVVLMEDSWARGRRMVSVSDMVWMEARMVCCLILE